MRWVPSGSCQQHQYVTVCSNSRPNREGISWGLTLSITYFLVRKYAPPVTMHNAYTSAGEYRKAYPEAKLIGVEALIEKKKAEGLVFDGGEFIQVTANDVLNARTSLWIRSSGDTVWL